MDLERVESFSLLAGSRNPLLSNSKSGLFDQGVDRAGQIGVVASGLIMKRCAQSP